MDHAAAVALCDRWLPAWTGNTPSHLITFYAQDAFYSDPTVKNGLKGRDALLPYFTKLLGNNPEWKWTREEVFPAEKGFTLKWKAVIPVRGAEIVEYGLDIVEVKGGLITRNEVYFDTRALIAAITGK
ncbi:MAG TPA: nuclear transport factor 2 family protein [Spirochaetota bacterium]|nr:nuclear transport factor 2 family protein [Spirochaetota bacterium]